MARLQEPTDIVLLGQAFNCLARSYASVHEFALAEQAIDRGIGTLEDLAVSSPWVLQLDPFRRLRKLKEDLAKSTIGTRTPDPDQSS